MKPQRFIALLLAIVTLLVIVAAFPIQTFAKARSYPNGTVIKASGPEVDRMQGGQRRWIPDPTTLFCMGLNWGMVQTIPDSAWWQIPVGLAYPSRANGTLLQGSGPAVYVMDGCRRHWIPDPATFNAHGYNWNAIHHITDADLWAIPVGRQIPPIQDTLTTSRYERVGFGLFMQTNVNVVKSNGLITATTHTWDLNAFLGFTGGVQIWLINKNGALIATTQVHTFSVDGRYVSPTQSDRTDRWSEQVDPQIASQATTVRIVQFVTQLNQSIPNQRGVGNSVNAIKNVLCAVDLTSATCQP